jgi:colanic acid/amylovoran biosynthesis glycosyltransferase
MKRVAQVKRFWIYGTETCLDNQMQSLKNFTPLVYAETINPNFRKTNYQVIVPPIKPRGFEKIFKAIKQMPPSLSTYFARQITIDGACLIHAHFGPEARYFLGVVKLTGLPLVVTFHGYDAYRFPNTLGGLAKYYYRKLWKQASMILTVSDHMRHTLMELGCPEEKLRVLKVGVNLELFDFSPPKPEETLRFVCVAGFTPKKGLHRLIEAFQLVRQKKSNAELVLIGDGPLREKCEKLASELGIAESITFTGHVPLTEVAVLLKCAHIYVQPSITGPYGDKEGIPATLMEALARGVPCIATRHSGIPELIEDGVSGCIVPENDVDALAQNMIELADHPERWQSMGEAGRMRVEMEHNLMIQTEKLEAIYNEFALPIETCAAKL